MPAGHTTGKSALQSRSRLTLSLSLLLSLTTLGACSNIGFPGVYRINVEQGNIVDQEMVDQLKPQMTRRQVRFVLGTPIIEDTFNADRWDYVHVVRLGNENLSRSQLTVVFEGDVLVDVEGDLVSENWPEKGAETEGSYREFPETDLGPLGFRLFRSCSSDRFWINQKLSVNFYPLTI